MQALLEHIIRTRSMHGDTVLDALWVMLRAMPGRTLRKAKRDTLSKSIVCAMSSALCNIAGLPGGRNAKKRRLSLRFFSVGTVGFEPTTSRTRSVRASQTALRPVQWSLLDSNQWPPRCERGALAG